MNDAIVQVLVVVMFALACGALTLAWVQRRLALGAAVLFTAAAVVWGVDVLLITSGFAGADEFAVCMEDCNGVHYSVVVGVLAPPLLISLAALAGIVVLEQRRRERRSR